jgi:hypothetical protein
VGNFVDLDPQIQDLPFHNAYYQHLRAICCLSASHWTGPLKREG